MTDLFISAVCFISTKVTYRYVLSIYIVCT